MGPSGVKPFLGPQLGLRCEDRCGSVAVGGVRYRAAFDVEYSGGRGGADWGRRRYSMAMADVLWLSWMFCALLPTTFICFSPMLTCRVGGIWSFRICARAFMASRYRFWANPMAFW
jgi:hypothetical protein